ARRRVGGMAARRLADRGRGGADPRSGDPGAGRGAGAPVCGGRSPRGPPRCGHHCGLRTALPASRVPRPVVGRARALRVPLPPRRLRRAHRARPLRPAAAGARGRARHASMKLTEFAKVGHWPTLLAAFVYFDLSFCVWYLLGPLANFIAEDLGLSATEKGLLVATPLLGGALFRIVMGALTDHVGARRTGLIGIGLTFVPLLLGWLAAGSLPRLFAVALLLGVPGASFAVALPLASRWYPPQHQGLAMGIAGAGNSGTVLAALFAPRLAERFGWHGVFGLALIPLAILAVLFATLAKDSPSQPRTKPLRDYFRI